jgi:molybdate transport system substrate-binding protein
MDNPYRSRLRHCGALAVLFMGWLLAIPATASEKTYVYAAASLTGAISTVVDQLEKTTGLRVVPVFGASSTLARQILNGAPANLFISAHPVWMERLASEQVIEPESLRSIAKNRLVLATGQADKAAIDLSRPQALLERLGTGRLAIADPDHVPAGLYARQALQSLNLWNPLKSRLAIAANARITVAYVERQETPVGIIYASDLTGRPGLSPIATFAEASHAPILYPMALIRGKSNPVTDAFRQFLQSKDGRAILTQFGFQAL